MLRNFKKRVKGCLRSLFYSEIKEGKENEKGKSDRTGYYADTNIFITCLQYDSLLWVKITNAKSGTL